MKIVKNDRTWCFGLRNHLNLFQKKMGCRYVCNENFKRDLHYNLTTVLDWFYNHVLNCYQEKPTSLLNEK
jgi:hypothetical protein